MDNQERNYLRDVFPEGCIDKVFKDEYVVISGKKKLCLLIQVVVVDQEEIWVYLFSKRIPNTKRIFFKPLVKTGRQKLEEFTTKHTCPIYMDVVDKLLEDLKLICLKDCQGPDKMKIIIYK